MTELASFDEALAASKKTKGNQHLLLGNGFSIACREDSFAYVNLFDEADFSAMSVSATSLFGLFDTADFEQVIEALRISASLLDIYEDASADVIERLKSDAESLKAILTEVLAQKHPNNVASIKDEEYESARRFLANFGGNIYSVNYDLLLYWTLLHDAGPKILHGDGFHSDPDEEEAKWVVWDGYEDNRQRIFFLHGGLHLYDAGSQLRKITWSRTGIPLVDQIRDALNEKAYPHVVTEGASHQKLARIEHSPYLHRGLKSLNRCGGSLFIFGHALADNDEHIIRRIENSKIESIFVSLHGNPRSAANRAIQHRAELMIERRAAHEEAKPERHRKSLSVAFYSAETALVWDGS